MNLADRQTDYAFEAFRIAAAQKLLPQLGTEDFNLGVQHAVSRHLLYISFDVGLRGP